MLLGSATVAQRCTDCMHAFSVQHAGCMYLLIICTLRKCAQHSVHSY
jgi:hypothetical protein